MPERQARSVLLALIVLIAAASRMTGLGVNPPGLQCDEAANGYDAYSLAHTGRDLYGRPFPLLINHFNLDYLESLYVYLAIPAIRVCGLSVRSLRLTSALLGTFGVLAAFLLGRTLLSHSGGLILAALLAVSPWHLHYSRIGWRQITAPLCLMLGLWLLHSALDKPRRLIPAAVALGLTANTYSSMKAAVPLLLALYLILFRKRVRRFWREQRTIFFISTGVFLLIFGGVLALSLFGGGDARFQSISVFSGPAPIRDFILNMAKYLDPRAIFAPGDPNARHHAPGHGVALPVLAPLILIALAAGLKSRSPLTGFALGWLVIGVFPGALTWDGIPHYSRSIAAIPALELLATIGVLEVLAFLRSRISRRPVRHAIITAIVLIITLNAGYYLHAELSRLPVEHGPAWEAGLDQAIQQARQLTTEQGKVFLSNRINQAYIFALFFSRLDPARFQRTESLGWIDVLPTDPERTFHLHPGSTIICRPHEFPELTPADLIETPDGEVAWKVLADPVQSEGMSSVEIP